MGGVVLSWRTVCTGGVASAFVASGFGLSVLVGVTGTGTAVFLGRRASGTWSAGKQISFGFGLAFGNPARTIAFFGR